MRFILIFLTSCVLVSLPVAAQSIDTAQTLRLVQNDGVSLSEAVESVRRQTDGRIISAETKIKNGREVHQIKVLTKDGKVKTHKVQGRTRGNG